MISRAPFAPRRRALLLSTAAAGVAPFALAQPGRGSGKPLTVAQIFDASAAHQDVSRDFLIGSRAAWQDINANGGVRGRPVIHLNVEVDGSALSVGGALAALREDPGCIVLS